MSEWLRVKCWTKNTEITKSYPTRVTFLLWPFLLSLRNAFDANFVQFVKNPNDPVNGNGMTNGCMDLGLDK